MFSKILKKETEKSEWVAWMCMVESKPASVNVDCLAHNEKNNELKSLVILDVKDLGTSRNGFPERDTFDKLYALEDKLKVIAEQSKSKYSGRFITDGTGYYLIYTNQPKKIKATIHSVMTTRFDFSFNIRERESNNWKDYYGMLYPPKREKQRYYNSVLIRRILQEEDNPDKEREIDHGIFFKSSKSREQYLKELKKVNFPFEKFEFFDNAETTMPFTLELIVISPLKLDIINSATDILIILSEKHNSQYDGWGAKIIR